MKPVIIDNNLICAVLADGSPLPISELRDAFLFGRGHKIVAVLGGRLEVEYYGHVKHKALFVRLIQAGRIRKVSTTDVDKIEAQFVSLGQLKSDDPHVIALAIVSGARVLCSHDAALHEDFTDPNVIASPRGKVWQRDAHNHLLR